MCLRTMDKVILILLTVVAMSHATPQGYSYSSPGYRPRPPTHGSGSGQHPYRPPTHFGSGGFGGEDSNEPANYQFQYDVTDPEYGTRFGHQESRQGDYARGRYYVTLPDGRTQVVEYTADESGYHPRISYS